MYNMAPTEFWIERIMSGTICEVILYSFYTSHIQFFLRYPPLLLLPLLLFPLLLSSLTSLRPSSLLFLPAPLSPLFLYQSRLEAPETDIAVILAKITELEAEIDGSIDNPDVLKVLSAPHTAQHSTAQHSTAQHNTAQHSTAQHSTAQHSTAQHNTAQHSTTQHSTAQHSTTQHNTAQHNTTQHNTAQHNTAATAVAMISCSA
jgi:hypothetical protein